MQTTGVQSWLQSLPTDIACGKGSEAQVTAACLFQRLCRSGYAASMDFTKCYDLMVPQGTVALLRAGGWPQGITALIQDVWCRQHWVSWNSHTHACALLAGTSCPQGCCFGPLALAAWMGAGVCSAPAKGPPS